MDNIAFLLLIFGPALIILIISLNNHERDRMYEIRYAKEQRKEELKRKKEVQNIENQELKRQALLKPEIKMLEDRIKQKILQLPNRTFMGYYDGSHHNPKDFFLFKDYLGYLHNYLSQEHEILCKKLTKKKELIMLEARRTNAQSPRQKNHDIEAIQGKNILDDIPPPERFSTCINCNGNGCIKCDGKGYND